MLPVSALSPGPSRELQRVDVFKIIFILSIFVGFLATYLIPQGMGYKLLFRQT